jgi:IS1 family transposase
LKVLKTRLEQRYSPRIYQTDAYPVYTKELEERKHRVGKDLTYAIEQHNSDTRHYGGRFKRKSKVVTKKPQRVLDCLWMVEWLTKQGGLERMRAQYLSI